MKMKIYIFETNKHTNARARANLWNQFFRELMRTIDVVAARDDDRQLKGLVVRQNQVLGRGFRGRIRIRRRQQRFGLARRALRNGDLAVHLRPNAQQRKQ